MYIDSSYPRRPGDVARLTSPELPATSKELNFGSRPITLINNFMLHVCK